MATLKVYHTASPSNAVYKSLGTAVTLSTDIVLPPSFDLYGDALRVISDTAADNRWNYAELTGAPAGGTWYYFIDRIEYLGGAGTDGAGYTLHLRVDPLMTWRNDILGSSLYVARNETDFDETVPDPILAKKYDIVRRVDNAAGLGLFTPSNCSYIVQTVSDHGYGTYIMSAADFGRFASWFWNIQWSMIFSASPLDCVVRSFKVPIAPSTIATAVDAPATLSVFLGNEECTTFGQDTYVVPPDNAAFILGTETVTATRPSGAWKSGFASYNIYIPYCGIVNCPATYIFDGTDTSQLLTIRYCVDTITGDITAELYRGSVVLGSVPIEYCNGNCSISVPMTGDNTTNRTVATMASLTSAALTAVSAMSGNVALSAGLAMSTIGNIYSSAQEQVTVRGEMAGGSSWVLPQSAYITSYQPTFATDDANFARTHGRPLYAIRTGSALTGFTICENVRVQPSTANAAAAAQIKSLLESGVYFDNGL